MKQFNFEEDLNLLYLNEAKDKQVITLKNCFPWSEGASFFSVRNSKDEEVAFISKIEELSPKDYEAIGKYFEKNCTQFKVNKIHSIVEEYDLRMFRVQTQFGDRDFQMKAEDWPIILSEGRILLYDINGDFYLIDDLNAFPQKEKDILTYLIE